VLVKEKFRPEDLVEHIRRLRAKQAGSHQRDGSGIVTKLLYVEDNDDNVYMLKMRLELLGDFEVVTAENGERGCEMAVLSAGHHSDGSGNANRRRLGGHPQAQEQSETATFP
jgi:hypothetical protein